MLKKRLIPVLILRNATVVQSLNFRHTNVIHSNVSIAVDYFNRWAADEIVVLDVSHDLEAREKFYEVVVELSKKCFVPLTVGGWIRSTDEVKTLLRCGADKVTINTAAVQQPGFIRECASIFGSQCIVASIDVRINPAGQYEIYIDRGRVSTGLSPFEWVKEVQDQGAGEIYLTSIDKDGSREGYDLELIKKISVLSKVPLIAFGGVSNWQHLADGILLGKVDAVSAANVFHYTEHSAKKAKEYMKSVGIDVR